MTIDELMVELQGHIVPPFNTMYMLQLLKFQQMTPPHLAGIGSRATKAQKQTIQLFCND